MLPKFFHRLLRKRIQRCSASPRNSNEPVDRYLLQDALERTLEDFPGFCCVLKRGLFWYYLEESATDFLVHEEDAPPCGILYHDSRSPLFDVSYYRCRINVELYHVLTDGAGRFSF